MSQVMEPKEQTTPAVPQGTAPAEAKPSLRQKWKNLPRKKRRKIIRRIILLLILVAAAGLAYKLLGNKDGSQTESQVITD